MFVLRCIVSLLLLAGWHVAAAAPPSIVPAQAPRSSASQQPTGPGYYTVKSVATPVSHCAGAWPGTIVMLRPGTISPIPRPIKGQVLRVIPPGLPSRSMARWPRPIAADLRGRGTCADQLVVSPPSQFRFAQGANRASAREPYSDEAYARLNKAPEAAKPADRSKAGCEARGLPATPPVAAEGLNDGPGCGPSTARSAHRTAIPATGTRFRRQAGDLPWRRRRQGGICR